MDPTARAFDALQIYLNATPDRPWPHVEQMALDRLRARIAELEAEVQGAWEAGHDAGVRSMLPD